MWPPWSFDVGCCHIRVLTGKISQCLPFTRMAAIGHAQFTYLDCISSCEDAKEKRLARRNWSSVCGKGYLHAHRMSNFIKWYISTLARCWTQVSKSPRALYLRTGNLPQRDNNDKCRVFEAYSLLLLLQRADCLWDDLPALRSSIPVFSIFQFKDWPFFGPIRYDRLKSWRECSSLQNGVKIRFSKSQVWRGCREKCSRE